jgi:hypothetical protein
MEQTMEIYGLAKKDVFTQLLRHYQEKQSV